MAAAPPFRSKHAIGLGLLGAIALIVWFAAHRSADDFPPTAPSGSSTTGGPPPASAAPMPHATAETRTPDERLTVARRWGSADDALGRVRPAEGNPEAPMSFAATPDGNLVVLDQVNGRVVRIARNGRTMGTIPLTERVAQDIAVAADGALAILDRVGDESVTVRAPSGSVIGRLPLRGVGVPEPGQVTGVFIDKNDVYVERRHGPLVLVGYLDGKAAGERTEIPGRPTRDGTLFVSAGIVDRREGRLFVSAIDRRSREHRFTREIRTGAPVRAIALLDSDRHGIIYVGVVLEDGQADWHRVYCMSPRHGEPQGQFEAVMSDMPEETLRDMTVLPDGGVVVAERTEQGVRYLERHCE